MPAFRRTSRARARVGKRIRKRGWPDAACVVNGEGNTRRLKLILAVGRITAGGGERQVTAGGCVCRASRPPERRAWAPSRRVTGKVAHVRARVKSFAEEHKSSGL